MMYTYQYSRPAWRRLVITAAATLLLLSGVSATAGASEIAESKDGSGKTGMPVKKHPPGQPAANGTNEKTAGLQQAQQMLLVHGYNGDADTNCLRTWGDAVSYYVDDGGMSPESITTIGYYTNDGDCDAYIGDGKATPDRSIKTIARDLAVYIHNNYTKHGRSVDIVAHSMGGLITRVAILGSAEGWEGFPPPLEVEDVATLGTPHQGVQCDDDAGDGEDNCSNSRQWQQMDPDSGFVEALQQDDRQLDDAWAVDTDWSLIGANTRDFDGDGTNDGDGTVSYHSAIDKNNPADQKYGYCPSSKSIDHSTLRELTGAGGFCLRYWHAWGDHDPHETNNGWSPLKAAFKAARYDGDDLPR